MSWSFSVPPSKNLGVRFVTFTAPFPSPMPAAPPTPILAVESCNLNKAVTKLVPTAHQAGASSWMGAGQKGPA